MDNFFISPVGITIEVQDHNRWAQDFVSSNYPGSEQYGNPCTRLVLDGWIKINNENVELKQDRMHDFKNHLLEIRADENLNINLRIWDEFNHSYNKIIKVKDIFERY